MIKKCNRVFLAKKSMTIDLEYGAFKIVAGKTYEDDGTTVFDVYLGDGSFEEVDRRPDTILIHHPSA